MKIDTSIGKPVLTPTGERKVVRAPDAKTDDSAQAAGGDAVNLTSSSQLQAMGSTLSTSSPVDTAKVDAIKQAISEGRFKINPDAIADRLLSSVQDLLNSQRA